jgi:hypothetical protein
LFFKRIRQFLVGFTGISPVGHVIPTDRFTIFQLVPALFPGGRINVLYVDDTF